MAIQTTVVKPLEAGYMQVDSTYKNGYKRHFKVPQKSARQFAEDFKELNKNQKLYDNIIFFTSILTAFGSSVYLTRKMDNKWKQFFIQVASTIGFSTLTSIGYAKYAQDEQREFLRNYRAKEIYYRA